MKSDVIRTKNQLNLFCFPYAGNGASMYLIDNNINNHINLIRVQLPGREEKILETPLTNMHRLVKYILNEYGLEAFRQPFAFFGHCVGALIAYELAVLLIKEFDILPTHFYVSSCPAPHKHNVISPMHKLLPEQFLEKIQTIGHRKQAAQLDKKVSNILLPGLLADFALYENYQCNEKVRLPCPITALFGKEDHYVPSELVTAWQELTAIDFYQYAYPGDHLYIHDHLGAVLQQIEETLLMQTVVLGES